MNEAEVVSYIKAGSLKNIQYIPEFRAICKEVYKTQVTEAQAVNYTVVNPISYCINEEKEDGTHNIYFKALGTTFMMNESGVTIVTFSKFEEAINKFAFSSLVTTKQDLLTFKASKALANSLVLCVSKAKDSTAINSLPWNLLDKADNKASLLSFLFCFFE